jgi:hypothetical protein
MEYTKYAIYSNVKAVSVAKIKSVPEQESVIECKQIDVAREQRIHEVIQLLASL